MLRLVLNPGVGRMFSTAGRDRSQGSPLIDPNGQPGVRGHHIGDAVQIAHVPVPEQHSTRGRKPNGQGVGCDNPDSALCVGPCGADGKRGWEYQCRPSRGVAKPGRSPFKTRVKPPGWCLMVRVSGCQNPGSDFRIVVVRRTRHRGPTGQDAGLCDKARVCGPKCESL